MILERTTRGEIVTIPDLLDPDFSKCQSVGDMIDADWSCRVSIERAIKTLSKKGLVRLGWARFTEGQNTYFNQWAALPLSVENPTQHLDTKGNSCFIRPSNPDDDIRSLKRSGTKPYLLESGEPDN